VLGALKPGYRCLHLRDPKTGTRIDMCALLVHITIGKEPHVWANERELRRQLVEQTAEVRQMQAELARKDERIGEQEQLISELRAQLLVRSKAARRDSTADRMAEKRTEVDAPGQGEAPKSRYSHYV